jgi:hypothetical protein
MQCVKCLFINQAGSAYCHRCGAQLSASPTTQTSSSNKGLWLIVGGIVALLGMFIILGALMESVSKKPSAKPEASAASTPATPSQPVAASPAKPEPPPSKWFGRDTSSEMDSSKGYLVTLPAENEIKGWLQSATPMLMVRCDEGQVEVAVRIDMPAMVEYGGGHTVRLRFDDKQPVKQSWSESTDSKALFAGNGLAIAKSIGGAETLRIELTPFNSSPQVIQFDVRGFKEHLDKILAACKKK